MSKRQRVEKHESDDDEDNDEGCGDAPPAAAAAAAATSSQEKKKRGRPRGSNMGPSVIDQVLENDFRGCEKAWAKWKTHVKYTALPPPYQADQYRCWDFTPKASGGSVATTGYGELQLLGRGKSKVKMHILAHFLHTGEQPQKQPKLDISHRCHRKLCFNPHHLVRETVEENCSRDYCFAVASIGGQYIDLCRHNPKCLRPGNAVKDFVVATVPAQTLLNALNASIQLNDASRAVIVAKHNKAVQEKLSAAAAFE